MAVVVLVSFSFSTGLFAGETGAKEKMIKGTISKVDCDNFIIAVSEVSDLRDMKQKLPDVTLKFNEKTKLTGVEGCKEILVGGSIFAGFVEGEMGNIATEMVFPANLKMRMKPENRIKMDSKYDPKEKQNLKQYPKRGSVEKNK